MEKFLIIKTLDQLALPTSFRLFVPGVRGTLTARAVLLKKSVSHSGVMWDLIILQHQGEPLDASATDFVTVRVDQLFNPMHHPSILLKLYSNSFPGMLEASIVCGEK